MLNHLFHGSVGFAWGVRASAFLNMGLLVIANLLMSARLPFRDEQLAKPRADSKYILRDLPFMLTIAG